VVEPGGFARRVDGCVFSDDVRRRWLCTAVSLWLVSRLESDGERVLQSFYNRETNGGQLKSFLCLCGLKSGLRGIHTVTM
jgi:hypothetical protein